MAGLIAGADIMFGDRTLHPYHTRPGMVSQGHDGDPPAPAGRFPALPVRPGAAGRGHDLAEFGGRVELGQVRGQAWTWSRAQRAHPSTVTW